MYLPEVGDHVYFGDFLGYLQLFDPVRGWLVCSSSTRLYVPPVLLNPVYKNVKGKSYISPNELQAPWKSLIEKRLVVEEAKSSRTRCSVCTKPIGKGDGRIGVCRVLSAAK